MNTAKFLKYVWPFYNIMHERVKKELKKKNDKLTFHSCVQNYMKTSMTNFFCEKAPSQVYNRVLNNNNDFFLGINMEL